MAIKMVDIHGELLNKLLCDFCGLYLSAIPILMEETGKNMCGRCSLSPEINCNETFKNHAYENLASIAYFPCKNYISGCLEKVRIDNSLLHEETCKHNAHSCPTYEQIKCPWVGKASEIEYHFKDSHSYLVIENPCRNKPDIRKNYSECVLFNDFNYTFLLQVKSDTKQGKFWHNVLIIAKPEVARLFDYCVKIGKDKAYNIKSKPVKAFGTHVYEDESIPHTIAFLQTDLGLFDELNFELRVTVKEEPCIKCGKKIMNGPILYVEGKGYFCNTCTKAQEKTLPPEERCKFSAKGCDYKTSEKFLLKKHEIYLCKTGYQCLVCGEQVMERLIDHHTKVHCMLIQTEDKHNVSKSTYIISWDKLNSYAFHSHGTLFFLKIKASKELICIELVSDTEEYGSEFFTCEYNLSFPSAPKNLTGELNKMSLDSMGTYDHPFDWTAYIYLPATFLRKMEFPDKINMELIITKRRNVQVY